MNQEIYKSRNRKSEKNSNKNNNYKGKLFIISIIMKKRIKKMKLDEKKFQDDQIKYKKYKEFLSNYVNEYQTIRWKIKRKKDSWDLNSQKPKTGRIIYKEYEGQIQ